MHELGIWIAILIGFLVTDGQVVLVSIYQGDYSFETLRALKLLLISSAVKAVLVTVFPALFPLYRKNVGILPPKEEPKAEEQEAQQESAAG